MDLYEHVLICNVPVPMNHSLSFHDACQQTMRSASSKTWRGIDITVAVASEQVGIMVGTEGIPSEQTDLLIKLQMIFGFCERFAESLTSLNK